MFAVWTEQNEPPTLKGIWISDSRGNLQEIPAHHPLTDSLCYTALFPHCDDGYHKQIPITNRLTVDIDSEDDDSDTASTSGSVSCSDLDSSALSDCSLDDYGDSSLRKKKFISVRDYIRYRLAIRKDEEIHHVWNSGGGLSQKFVLDYAARIDSDVASFLRRPDMDLRATLPENALRWLANNANVDSIDQLGSVVMFRKNHPGTRPYFQDMFYDATTIMARTRKPGYASFMFTFTSNPQWPEIKRNLMTRVQKKIDRFDLTCRVFEGKLIELHRLIKKKEILGKVKGSGQSREFQKRYGGPHIHRVYTTDVLAVPENIDNLIWAHIPKPPPSSDTSDWANFIRRIRVLLPKHQFHDCGDHCQNQRGRCSKGFPKPFRNFTILHDNRPAEYFRPSPNEGGEVLQRGNSGIFYDNSRVVQSIYFGLF